MAPALTIGFMVRSSLSSMAITELKARPVAFTPRRRRASSWPTASQTRAKTKALEMLWMENGTAASPTEVPKPLTPQMLTANWDGSALARAGM